MVEEETPGVINPGNPTDDTSIAVNPEELTGSGEPSQEPMMPSDFMKTPVSHHPIKYILAIVVAAALVGVIYYFKSGSISVPLSSTTTIQPAKSSYSSTDVGRFMPTFNLPTSPPASQVLNATTSECHVTQFVKWYLASNSLQTGSAINYSQFNKSMPYAEYVSIGAVDPSFLANYTQRLSQNGGYCRSSIKPLLTNATFSYSVVSFAGASGYLLRFSNFTNNALNLTATYYTGQRPNVNWYSTAVMYKNVQISVGFWGFAGYMNASQLIRYTNLTLQAFKSQYP